MAFLYGRGGCLTARNAGFRPGQWARPAAAEGAAAVPWPHWRFNLYRYSYPNGPDAGRGQGSVALLLCAAARPVYTGIANILGAISETAMRPNPRFSNYELNAWSPPHTGSFHTPSRFGFGVLVPKAEGKVHGVGPAFAIWHSI